jgi:hypothetical protein
MSVRSRWLFILVGDNRTGKTTVQTELVELLNGRRYKRLPSNEARPLTHPYFLRKFRAVFVAGRSYQELKNKPQPLGYTSVEDYFDRKLDSASSEVDLAFMASHLNDEVVREMIREAHRRFWNVCGVFFTNSIAANHQKNVAISELDWDERWLGENAPTSNSRKQDRQLRQVADAIVQMLMERSRGW